MLETFRGLPLHPLVVHAVVVFVPLLVLGVLAYVFLPRYRSKIDWAVVALAILAPLTSFLAKETGEAFRARLIRKNMVGSILPKIDHHMMYGNWTFYLATALGVVALVLVLWRRRPVAVSVLLSVIAIGLAIPAGIFVYLAGDSAAQLVWTGY
jgi:uncharacterized membrane protein